MGLMGKSFTTKLKNITSLAISRIAILINHRKARASYAFSDVVQLLNFGYHDQALVRVEHWILEQNMLDTFVMIENYCNVLRERVQVLENNKECPFELKEATCSLIFASSRCGEFPELHKIQDILTLKFGKEFADHAVKLHKNNGVNSKMIQNLSSRHPTLEIKMKALKKIATEIGVTLTNKDKLNVEQRQQELETKKYSSVDDAKHEEKNQHYYDQSVIEDNNIFDVNEEERRRNKYAAAAVLQALELASFEISKYSNHKQKKDVVISKRNFSIDHKEELEGKEIKKQYAWKQESKLSQNPKEQVNATNLVSKENTNRQSNMVDDNNDHHKSEFDAPRENEDLSEERTYPSSQAIRWNPQRSQTNHAVNLMARRHEVETFPKKMHAHLDWKMMSVRTR